MASLLTGWENKGDGMSEPITELGPSQELMAASMRGLLSPMGDGPYPRRIWEPWQAGIEPAPGGITLGTDDHTEMFCRVSGYLRPVEENARRMCACWNAFIGVPLAEIEAIARERSGWQPPARDAMWRWPNHPAIRRIAEY